MCTFRGPRCSSKLDGEAHWAPLGVVGVLRGSPLFSAMQSVTSAGNNTFYMVGVWADSWNSTDGDVRSASSARDA